MTEKQADHVIEMLDRIATSLERLVELQVKKQNPFRRESPESLPEWMKNLPPRDKPPEAEL